MDNLLWTPSPNHSSRNGMLPKAIVWHTMVGTMQGTASWFAVGKDKPGAGLVSAHFGIAKNGDIHQYVSLKEAAWHCGTVYKPRWGGLIEGVNPNQYTIGVEFEGNGNEEELSDSQLVGSGKLSVALCVRYSYLEYVTHNNINGTKSCPGSRLQIELVRAVARVIHGSSYFNPEEFLKGIR